MNHQKTILITGSNRGIGFEIARQCAQKNFHVFISGRNKNALEDAQSRLRNENLEVEILVMDVSNNDRIQEAASVFRTKKIKLDVLINNAAIGVKGDNSITYDREEILTETMNSNGYGPLRVTKYFLPMISSPGRIIMISSGGGSMSDEPGGWWPAYCVSKTFLNAVTRQLAYDLRKNQIAVNSVCPGWVRTKMGGSGAPRSIEKGAETPVWLASEASQKLTGLFFRDKKEIPW